MEHGQNVSVTSWQDVYLIQLRDCLHLHWRTVSNCREKRWHWGSVHLLQTGWNFGPIHSRFGTVFRFKFVFILTPRHAINLQGYTWIKTNIWTYSRQNIVEVESLGLGTFSLDLVQLNFKSPKSSDIHIWWLILQGNVHQSLPYIVFGGCALLSGILSVDLPDTLGVDLPETVEEAAAFSKYNWFLFKRRCWLNLFIILAIV